MVAPMQKATPLILLLILVVTAMCLSMRAQQSPVLVAAPVVEVPEAAPTAPTAPVQSDAALKPDAAATVIQVPSNRWPQATSDIAPDPEITFGTLDNGLRYIIQPNSEPPGRVSLRLHIATGSLMEADDQRGLAHFLEHMMFNGTQHFTVDELIPRMQRLGIAFGAHVNAYTSFDETVYMLDLPDISPPTLDLAFTVLRDFSDGALLDPAEIDQERGVILSEKISRDSVNYRLMEQQFAKILPDSLIARRFPIGLEEVIKTASRERLADLYTRNYTPERITFIVVGDVKPAAIRARITSAFSSMKRGEQAATIPDLGKIHAPEGLETAVFSDKEVTSTEVSIMLVKPHVRKPDTTATRAAIIPLEIAHSIIGRRCERLSKEQNSPVAEGSASRQILFNAVELGSISITAADDRWQDVVPIIEQEFRRALDFGFSAAELVEAKSNLLNRYEQEVKQKTTCKSDHIATAIVKSINEQAVASSPETDLEIVRSILDASDSETCHKAFKALWEVPGYYLILTTKDNPANAAKDLAALFEASRQTPVETPAARAIQVFDYTNFGKAGTVTTRKEVADLRISQCVFSNKVRVNLKRTDFEHGKIRLLARIGAGKLSQPQATPMLDDVAAAVLQGGGLGKHSNDDLEQLLA
ncbi:MAG: pitrilysin family protein, partial [Verrucomicrobiota bacterium]